MKANLTKQAHEKLYLVPPDVYEKIMNNLDSSESNQISTLNENIIDENLNNNNCLVCFTI